MSMRLLLVVCILMALAFREAAAHTIEKDPCPSMTKSRLWSASCFERTTSGRRIKKEHMKNVKLDRKGFAAVVIESPAEFVNVNRYGKVVKLRDDHLHDFHFEPGEGAVSRFGYSQGGKRKSTAKFRCGYYYSGTYQVLVPPLYDNCGQFYDGSALVCFGCTSHCESGDCHEDNFAGGEGLVINAKNEVIRRFALPSLPRCEGHAEGSADEKGEKKCRPREPNPFDKLM